MGLADMAVAGNRQKEETTPTFYDIRQTTTTLGQRKINWFGESSRLLEFDRPLTEPGASKLTKVFLATRTAVWNQVSGAPRHRRDIADLTHSVDFRTGARTTLLPSLPIWGSGARSSTRGPSSGPTSTATRSRWSSCSRRRAATPCASRATSSGRRCPRPRPSPPRWHLLDK